MTTKSCKLSPMGAQKQTSKKVGMRWFTCVVAVIAVFTVFRLGVLVGVKTAQDKDVDSQESLGTVACN